MSENNYTTDNEAYERAELDRLKEVLKRSYKERFLMTTRLYKIQKTMNRFTIIHKPFLNK